MSNGQRIIDGLVDAVAHARGGLVGARVHEVRVPDNINVQAIRAKLGLTQREFALRFGFSLGTVRHWEQGLRVPEGPTRILLKVIDKDPEAVIKALATA